MDYIRKYRDRITQAGENVGDAITNNTVAFIENTFTDSPTYRLAEVESYERPDIEDIDIRAINMERLGSIKEVLFRPTFEGLGIGSYLKFDGDTWLIFDRYSNNKVLVQRCNETVKWMDENGQIIERPCVASASDLGSKAKQSRNELEWNKYDVSLPMGQLFIFVEMTDITSRIRLNQRFIFGSKVYEVIGYDDVTAVEMATNSSGSRFGILQVNIKVTTIREEDNFNTRIADNRSPISDDNDNEDDGGWNW